jgi:hypothetical protein
LGLVVSVLIPASLGVGVWVWTLPVTIEIWFIIIGYFERGPASVGHLFLAPEPRRRRRRSVDHLPNLEQLLVFSSHVVGVFAGGGKTLNHPPTFSTPPV